MSKEKNVELLNKNVDESNLVFKVIVIGDSFVGKSCLTVKAVQGVFDNRYSSTVGFEFLNYSVKLDNQIIKLQIWDTCGQETYRSLISSFYHSSSMAILVYSIDNEQSFNNLEDWINEIKTKGNPDINMILVGNKADLENKRKVTKEMANEMCETHNIKIFMETSAKSGLNVENIFFEAAKVLLEQHKKYRKNVAASMSMRNVIIGSQMYDKDSTREISISEGDTVSRKKKKNCCD